MDNQTMINQFEELENKLGKLINNCKAFEKETIELKNKIDGLEEELRGKVAAENSYRQEREQIKSKIDYLIKKFNDVENE